MIEWIGIIFCLAGSLLFFLSCIGIVVMDDFLLRLQVASKASTLGSILIFLGASLYVLETELWIKAILIIVFIFLTTPLAAHVIALMAYRKENIRFKLNSDELKDSKHNQELF